MGMEEKELEKIQIELIVDWDKGKERKKNMQEVVDGSSKGSKL